MGSDALPALPLVGEVRPIYGDTDQMGVVYYANYLRYFEVARTECMRALAVPYRAFEETHGLLLPVVEAAVAYKQAARYDDQLALHCAMSLPGRATLRFDYEIRRAGALVVSGHTVHACVDRSGRPQRLPEDLVAAAAGAGVAAPSATR